RVGDHGIDRTRFAGDLALAHAVADHLAAAEFHLLAVGAKILLHLDDDVGVGKAHAVAGRGTEHFGVDGALYLGGHLSAPYRRRDGPRLRIGRTPAIFERGPQDVVREFEPVAAAAVHGLRREVAHSVLIVGRILRGGNERGGRVLHVDVDDRVDDLVAPRLQHA